MASDTGAHSDAAQDQPRAVSPTVRRRLQECYERGCEMAGKDPPDFDYATTMFTQCILNDPGNLVYVEAFLSNLERKYDNNKKGARIKGFGGRGGFKKARAAENWKDVLRFGPELLKSNPWDVPVLRGIAQACEAMAYNESELRYLKNALVANTKDAEVNRHCGNSLARMGQFDQAIACFHRIEELKKNDEQATKMISLLTEDKARVSQGLPPKWVPQPRGRAREDAEEGAERQPGTEQGEIEHGETEQRETEQERDAGRQKELVQKIEEDPTGIDNYLELSALFSGHRNYADAERVLTKALAASGNDLKVRESLEDVQLERSRQKVAIAEKRAAAEQTEESRSLVKKLRQDMHRQELEITGSRAERYPDDKHLVLRLAILLKRIGNYQEAIKHLIAVREEPELKAQATLELGECMQHQKKFAKALQCYVRSAELAEESSESKKLALYRAGVLAAGMKEPEKAEQYLQQLASLDQGYKDTQARLDKLRQIRDKG